MLVFISLVGISMANPYYSSVPMPTNPAFYETRIAQGPCDMVLKSEMNFADNLVVVDLMPASDIYSQPANQESLDEISWNQNKEQRLINFSQLVNKNEQSKNNDC